MHGTRLLLDDSIGLFGRLDGDDGAPKKAKKKLPPIHSDPEHADEVFQLLYEWFGSARRAIQFMQDHAGIVIVLPDEESIERISRDKQIVASLERDPSQKNVNRLSELYEQPTRMVSKTFKRESGEAVTARRSRLAAMHCRGRVRMARGIRVRV